MAGLSLAAGRPDVGYGPAVARAWEYAFLRVLCDPGAEGLPSYGYLATPPDTTKWQELGLLENVLQVLLDLGSEGWEMMGPPTGLKAVFSYQAANDTWHDRAYYVEKDYWFKRELSR